MVVQALDGTEAFTRRGWSDGLPIVPPTRERVGAFLKFTDRVPDEVLRTLSRFKPHLLFTWLDEICHQPALLEDRDHEHLQRKQPHVRCRLQIDHLHGPVREQPRRCVLLDTQQDDVGMTLVGFDGGIEIGLSSEGAIDEIVDLLRQRSRPYLFSNSLAPVIASTTLTTLDILRASGELRQRLEANADRFRSGMEAAGFTLAGADHPIIPVMLGDARIASEMADRLLDLGIYVIGFSFPVVPRGEARIRTQMSAAHTPDQIDQAIEAFASVGKDMGVVP